MFTHSRKWLWMALLLSWVAADGARGQWKIVVPNLVIPSLANWWGGALHYKDGIVWAGGTSLSFSEDSGSTWNQITFNQLPLADGISDISFCNKDTGIVCTTGGEMFQTFDRGLTWNAIGPSTSSWIRLSYNHSPLVVHALNFSGSGFYTSLDGGRNWSTQIADNSGFAFTLESSGVIYLIIDGTVNSSTDFGKTWNTLGSLGTTEFDSYSMDVDSCDLQRLYIANEDFYGSGDGFSDIYTSSDGGMNWSSTFAHLRTYLAGSFAVGPQTEWAPTIDDGILRSTDHGTTWAKAAPFSVTNPGDSRAICVINDNIVFALDSAGNIWRTMNSGGNSVPSSGSFSASPAILFSADTVSCDSLTRSVLFIRGGCAAPSVSAWSVVGSDSASFKVSNHWDDSISVKFYGNEQGDQHAQLVLALNNGTSDTIALAGYVNIPSNTFTASPATVFAADTIFCDSLTRSVSFSRGGCSQSSDTVTAWSIIGSDAASFRASNLSYDSILVTLYGTKQGAQNANLVLLLSDGKSYTIALAGYVNLLPSVLTLSTEDIKTDTLGGTVAVPITINNLRHAEDVELILHYNGTMDYLGSFSPLGAKLDIPGEQWAGRSELNIVGALPGVIAGYAKFNVFNDSSESAHASFDSVNILTAISPCEYSLPEAVTSTITAPSGCGITILSQFVHLGLEPRLSVWPNPGNGDVWISSSDDLGDVTFAIYDMLGVRRSEIAASVSKDNPVELTLPQADGVYNIVAKYSDGMSTMRVVREHY